MEVLEVKLTFAAGKVTMVRLVLKGDDKIKDLEQQVSLMWAKIIPLMSDTISS